MADKHTQKISSLGIMKINKLFSAGGVVTIPLLSFAVSELDLDIVVEIISFSLIKRIINIDPTFSNGRKLI